MKKTVFFCLMLLLCSYISCKQTNDSNEKVLQEDGPKPTAPSENRPIKELVDSDEPEILSTEALSGEWIVTGYDLSNYVHLSGMSEKQENNFERLVSNLIGKMKFIFEESGEYRSYTGLPFHFSGSWFIDENGTKLTMQQKFEVKDNDQRPLAKVNVYTIEQFSKNYLTLTDTDNLTFIFKKS